MKIGVRKFALSIFLSILVVDAIISGKYLAFGQDTAQDFSHSAQRKKKSPPQSTMKTYTTGAPQPDASTEGNADHQNADHQDDIEFSLEVATSVSSNIYVPSHPNFTAGVTPEITGQITFHDLVTTSGSFGITKEITGKGEWDYLDLIFVLGLTPREVVKPIYIGPALSFEIPTSEGSYELKSTRLTLEAKLPFIFRGDDVGLSHFSVKAGGNVRKEFHEFTTSTDGTSNLMTSTTLFGGLNYKAFGLLDLGIAFGRTWGWTYGTTTLHRFSMSETILLTPLPRFTIALSHSNAGNILKANGYETNFSVLSEAGSTVTLGLSYAIL